MDQPNEQTDDAAEPLAASTDAADSAGSVWCFQCAREYLAPADTCEECGVGLVATKPLPAMAVGGVDEEQLAYELHEWAFESRRMVDQVLTAERIQHAWQGAVLIVREADEARVDTVIDEVEANTLPTLDEGSAKAIYGMEGWDASQQTEFSNRLGLAGIAHQFNADGDLVVMEADEEAVDAAFDSYLNELDDAVEDERATLDGLEANELLSALFEAASRLARDGNDYKGRRGIGENGARVRASKRPFGFETSTWQSIGDDIDELARLFDADADEEARREGVGDGAAPVLVADDEEVLSERIADRAKALRERLRELI